MKNIFNQYFKHLIVFLGSVILVTSCQYKEIAEAQYSDQLIYMPAAKNGIFVINTVALPVGNTTPGNVFRYKIDLAARKFIVPLGVYRSGINNDGNFNVDITVNSDTVSKLIVVVPAKLPGGTTHLPSNKYSVVPSVEINNGSELATFDLLVDLDFLVSNAPGQNYALGISISSNARKTNPLLSTTVIVIGTDMMKPTAAFTSSVSSTDVKTWNFSGNSLMTVDYSWDFGDGSAVSKLKAPSHTYNAAGTYTVKQTALGVTGQENKSVKTEVITVL